MSSFINNNWDNLHTAERFSHCELLQGDAIFVEDHVLILQDSTSADLGASDGHTGIVVATPSTENPLFVVRLDSTKEKINVARARLRPMTHEEGNSYREDLGYGRGQRVSQVVDRTDKVDLSKMTDKQFDKHMRDADKEEDEVGMCVRVCARACAHVCWLLKRQTIAQRGLLRSHTSWYVCFSAERRC